MSKNNKSDCLYFHGNEVEDSFLDHYSRNLHSHTVLSHVLRGSSKMNAAGIRNRCYEIDF